MSDDKVPVKQDDLASGVVTNAQMAKIISEAVAEALKVAIPAAAVGINAAQTQANDASLKGRIREAERRTKRCPICALPESACGGAFAKDAKGDDIVTRNEDGSLKWEPSINHVKHYCGPQDESLFKWFQGVIIKGVRFLSDHYGHLIWIPKKSDIPTLINAWERNEKDLSQKRSAEGNGMGYASAGGVVARSNQPAIGWR